MRAFTLDSFGAPPALRDIREPQVGDSELLVRVHASSINPVDIFIAAGGLKKMVEHEFPVTIGRDFAGVVEQVGSGVSSYQVGDEVFGFLLHANPTVHDGSWAELITVPEDRLVAAKPRSLDFARAGAAPLVDVILDLASPTPDTSILNDAGRLASPLGAAGEGTGRFNIMAQPTPANLQRLAELLDACTLRVPVQRSYRLEQAGEALRALPTTHTQGKLGLTIA